MPSPYVDAIAAILRDQCLVLVAGGRTTGSGFFAAPGLVLTCAHVTGAEMGRTVSVSWQGRQVAATVRWASAAPPDGKVWPYPDLAIVELDEGPFDHACALLEQRYPLTGSDLLAVGHSVIYDSTPDANPVLVRCGGLTAHPPQQFLKLDDNELPEGMSGGPVLALDTGAVCGITKVQRKAGTAMGGRAVPLKALRVIEPSLYRRLWRAHDRHHTGDSDWLWFLDRMRPARPSGLDHREERQLRGLLADIPGDDDPHRLRWNKVAGVLAPDPEATLVDRRDVVDDLSELFPRSGRDLPYAVAYSLDVAQDSDQPHADRLRAWAAAVAGRLSRPDAVEVRPAVAAAEPETVSVMAELTPASQDRTLVRLNMWRHLSNGDSVPVHLGRTSMTPDRAWRKLEELLPAELEAAGGAARRVRVEIIAALEQMQVHVGGWRLWPDQQWAELGRRYPVVLRDVERRYDQRVLGVWRDRWDSLDTAPRGVPLTPIICEERPREEYDGLIEADPDLGALALAASPFGSTTRAALEVALRAGVPVVLWQRRECKRCPANGPGKCPGATFVHDLAEELHQIPLDELPERVRLLRNRALTSSKEVHCGQDLVLVWDNPRRQPPPMMRPQPE